MDNDNNDNHFVNDDTNVSDSIEDVGNSDRNDSNDTVNSGNYFDGRTADNGNDDDDAEVNDAFNNNYQ